MRKCIDEGMLQAWFDDELDANTAADVAAHLDGCIHCVEAARTIEVENLIVSQGLSAEFGEAVPTERLRNASRPLWPDYKSRWCRQPIEPIDHWSMPFAICSPRFEWWPMRQSPQQF